LKNQTVELNRKFGIEIGADPVSVLEAVLTHERRVIRIHAFLPKAYADIVTQPLGVEHLEIEIGREVA
jgi:hypothetical protein